MQCVEFESRLNDLLDERLLPGVDRSLAEHAQSCPGCCELLAAHELLLEGIQALPTVHFGDSARQRFAGRVVAEVGSSPLVHFRPGSQVELAKSGPVVVAKRSAAPLAIAGLVLAAAAAVLIAALPAFREPQPAVPAGKQPLLVGTQNGTVPESPDRQIALRDYEDLAPIARVGYQVADGLTPVTNSMVSALRELRKRPFFRSTDEPPRSSFYCPCTSVESVA
jgi:hypothetical protein